MMNILDIIILVFLAYAVYTGAKDGVIIQVCSLLSVVLGIYLGGRLGHTVAERCGIEGEYSLICGYAIVIVLTILLVNLAAYVIRKFFQVAGLGIVDRILGIALSLCKYLLILSVLLSLFNSLNNVIELVSPEKLNSSILFQPIVGLTKWITPLWSQITNF